MSVKPKLEPFDYDQRPMPLYEMLKRRISEAILSGKWPAGMVLPSETALAQQFSVAPGTMRRALSDLTAEGLLTRRRKTGTIVTGRSPNHSLRFFFQYFRLHRADGTLVTSETVNLAAGSAEAGALEAASLLIAPGDPVIRIRRIRKVEGRAIMRETLTLSAARVDGFPTEPDRLPELLLLYLVENYGIRVTAVREELSAVASTAEDEADLQLSSSSPLLQIVQIAFDQTGQPVIYAEQRCLTEDYRYINEVQ